MKNHILTVASLMVAAVTFVGCEPGGNSASNEQDKLKLFADSVGELVGMRNTIRDSIAAGDLDAAHGPLHEVGHVLEGLADQAKTAQLTEDKVLSVAAASETLLDAFGEVDKTFHGAEGATYDEVSEKIDTALATITEIAGVENPSAPATTVSGGDFVPAGTASDAPIEEAPVEATDGG